MDLKAFFEAHPRVAIAFSGGVDSTYLVTAAAQYAQSVHAYTIDSAFVPRFELEGAKALTKKIGITHTLLPIDVLQNETVVQNPKDRCYFCKKAVFSTIWKAAKKDGYNLLLDGTNASDDASDRPGMKALAELDVLSPLRLCGLTKSLIRERSRALGLPTWNKPSYACLATRVPTGTRITPEVARKIRDAGFQRCSISIDEADAARHDEFRRMKGAFEASMRGIENLKQAGMEFQINTTVTRSNLASFKNMFELCEKLGAAAWHIFLLVPTVRGAEIEEEVISAEEYEEVLHWCYDFRKTTSMHLKATCAPHYYRIMRQRAREEGVSVTPATFGMDAMTRGCLGGTGFCFISHVGQVQPCGYLTLDCGNVRTPPFPEIWRKSKPFLQFRDQSEYKGKCGICEFHKVCGGCRARAWSMDGDYMGEEPLCTYQPRKAKEAE